MTNRCPSCSQPGGERSNPQAEARRGEPASRNASELDSASLHYVGATILPEVVKSATGDEATPECNRRAPRGVWRQRVGKEKSRNLRGPSSVATPRRESDDPIVAGKGLTRLERRGSAVNVQRFGLNASAWPLAPLRKLYASAGMDAEQATAWECSQESRMREIRTSGSKRGSSGFGQPPPAALYSTALCVEKKPRRRGFRAGIFQPRRTQRAQRPSNRRFNH